MQMVQTPITSENFALSLLPKSFANAEEYCKETFAASLAKLDTAQKIEEARNLCAEYELDCWIGLMDTVIEGTWKWMDGTSLGTNDWSPGEPNNSGEEDCALIRGSTAACNV